MNRPSREILKHQCAIITGASTGIGAAIAITFARAGAKVGVNHHNDAASADRIVNEICATGADAIALDGDVSSERDVRKMFGDFVGAFGRVDILVANAGIQRDAPAAGMTLDQWQAVIDVNLTGQFLCAREAIRHFLNQTATSTKSRGKIIFMSSVHESIPWAGHVNYAASKAGGMLMMKSLAQEMAGKQIRVNGIAPGAIKTRINEDVWSEPSKAGRLRKLIPCGRIGEPDDIAQVALWLVSDAADYIYGTTILVDGGLSLMMGTVND